ncbi:hypothetical protein JRI60_24610 [Archangium violaceum]|uniref:hypothetical protein n=1 Tax=Archangium violaceum TaxID=83451 RepID=UPI00195154A2|nr:hypothetical protein [Archangium violaceum]QRO01970.1 hypothetical protein JRI60_24610 [Archangium violaceum]
MFGRRKSKKSDPVDPVKLEAPVDTRPSVAKERVERGLEAEDIRPHYDADSTHPSQGHRFFFDIDGPVPFPGGPLDEAGEGLHRRYGAPGSNQGTD